MEVAFHVTTSFGMTHVILETTTRTRTLKGGGFGLTLGREYEVSEGAIREVQDNRENIL